MLHNNDGKPKQIPVRVDEWQLEQLKAKYPLLTKEQNTTIIRLCLSTVLGNNLDIKFFEELKPNIELAMMIRIAHNIPKFRQTYEIQMITEQEKILRGWQSLVLHEPYKNDEEFSEAIKKIAVSELRLVNEAEFEVLYLLEDMAISKALTIKPRPAEVYERIAVPTEVFKRFTEVKSE
jgi:hypothetical protein